jgi:PTH1 family peptidyl-tRNA hydrolase
VVDELASRFGITAWKTKDAAAQAYSAHAGVVLVKPLSFMNESGQPLGNVAAWWKTPPEDVLVVSDDLDLPFGRLRMRASGGSGGHNGLKSIIARFGEEFPRLRVGIGRGRADTIDYVLSNFSGDEEAELGTLVAVAADGVERWLRGKTSDAIAFVNGWRQPGREDTPRAS